MPLTAFRDAYLPLVASMANFNMVTRGSAGFPVGRTYRYFNDSDARRRTGAAVPFIQYHFGYGLSYCTCVVVV